MTMADKIVVLRDGRVEQVGAPLELYHNPVNQFVAGFIGSPRMNFLNAQVTAMQGNEASLLLTGGEEFNMTLDRPVKVGDVLRITSYNVCYTKLLRIIDLNHVPGEGVGHRIEVYLEQHRPLPVTAIFAFNDIAAQQMIEALIEQGYRVPEDVVVVGFDNTPLARVMGITSIAQPMQEIGRLAFQEVLVRLGEPTQADRAVHLSLLPRLVVRESTLKVRKRKAEPGLIRNNFV